MSGTFTLIVCFNQLLTLIDFHYKYNNKKSYKYYIEQTKFNLDLLL